MMLALPPNARGLILVASDAEGLDRAVARRLLHSGFATFLVDLAGTDDASVLADRVVAGLVGLSADAYIGDFPPSVDDLPLGCFASGAAGTGALRAAAVRPDRIHAVVARDGARVTLCARGGHRARVCLGDDAA
jgi:putative phosphoribosyl transferase